ncbi:MAG: helix-turn-helix domain-containing protein [Pseudomonadota bacterium]
MTGKTPGSGVDSGAVSIMIAFGQSRGVSVETMAAASGLSPAEIFDPVKRLPDEAGRRLWAYLWDVTQDKALPLKMATAAPMTVFAGLAEGSIFAANLREALTHIQQNISVVADRLRMEIREYPDGTCLSVSHPLDASDDGHLSSLGILLLKRLVTDVLCVKSCVKDVRLSLPDNGAQKEYKAFFESPVLLSQPDNVMRLQPWAFDQPINHANAELFSFVKTHFLQKRAVMRGKTPSQGAKRLREAIIENALHHDYRLKSVASRANLSLRTAQRMAAAEGVTLQSLVDDVRFENARSMLLSKDLSIAEVADVLGYSDDRSFRRAFKKRTGVSPSVYRSNRN